MEASFARLGDGAVDLDESYPCGERNLTWKGANTDKSGVMPLGRLLGRREWAVGYAFATVESVHPREAVLHCGSDDGIRVWLNGRLVVDAEGPRAHQVKEHTVPVHLTDGPNRILVKIDNWEGGWSFSLGLSRPNF